MLHAADLLRDDHAPQLVDPAHDASGLHTNSSLVFMVVSAAGGINM